MNVLMISGDKTLLDEGSAARARLQLQRSQVDRLDVLVWPQVHSFRQVCHAARATRYDVVTAQDPFWRGLIAWRVARRTGAKLNLQVHADLKAQSLAKRLLARFTLPRADSIRVVSEKVAADVRRIAPRVRVNVLPIYVDLSTFQSIMPVPHAQKTILWVGRFEKEKDPLFAVEVLKKVRALGVDARLVMLGDGSLMKELRFAAQGLAVELPGWQNPQPYLAEADVVLSTSREESWGASIVEALAAGVPVVAPDVGVAREAGAVIAERSQLAQTVAETLEKGLRGSLKLSLLGAEEWARHWKETLI